MTDSDQSSGDYTMDIAIYYEIKSVNQKDEN